MISSNIKVVSNLGTITQDDLTQPDQTRDVLSLNFGGTVSGGTASSGAEAGGCCAAGAKATKFANGNIPTEDIAVAKIENNQQIIDITVDDLSTINLHEIKKKVDAYQPASSGGGCCGN